MFGENGTYRIPSFIRMNWATVIVVVIYESQQTEHCVLRAK